MMAGSRAEQEFLLASIAVWREIDRLSAEGNYPGIPSDTDLRQREKEAWEAYRAELNAAPEPPEGSWVTWKNNGHTHVALRVARMWDSDHGGMFWFPDILREAEPGTLRLLNEGEVLA